MRRKKTNSPRRAVAATRSTRPPLARMLRLHEELSARRYPNCRKLAEALEVADKTIQRDLDFMRDQLDLPVAYDAQRFGFYYTSPVHSFPTVQVSEGELLALFVAQKALGPYRGTPFEKPLQAAFRKLTDGLNQEVSFSPGDWEAYYSFRSTGAPVADLERFELLSTAVRESHRVRFLYRKLKSTTMEERTVEPYHLACVDNQWYLFGRDLARDSMRTFVLTRMSGVQDTGESFQRPADFSPERMLDGSFGVFSGSGKTSHVRLAFDAFASQLVRERVWHSSQKIRENPDGTLELELKLKSLPEIERWVLSWGAHVRVKAPAELVESVKASIRAMERSYRG